MSLAADFHMYYGGTYIGYRRGDVVCPFYVEEVRFDMDEDELYDNYTEDERYYHMVFYGNLCFDMVGNAERFRCNYGDDNLILEIPDLGYYNHNGVLRWITLTPVRSVKKGLNERRLSGSGLCSRHFFSMFNPELTANSLGRISEDFALINDEIHYKGVLIGSVSDEFASIVEEASYLRNIVSKKLNLPVNIIEDS